MVRRKNSPAPGDGSSAAAGDPAGAPENAAATPDDGTGDSAGKGHSRSRRDFLRLGGLTAAGAVVGGGAGAAAGYALGQHNGFAEALDDYGALAPRHAPGFDHIVVVMGENRSFDNLLGYLYTKENLPEG